MSAEDVSEFSDKGFAGTGIFDFHNPDEVIYWYCYSQQLGYHRAEELKKRYEELEPDESYTEAPQVYSGKICLDTEDKLLRYLAYVKVGADDPMSEKKSGLSGICPSPYSCKRNHREDVSGG